MEKKRACALALAVALCMFAIAGTGVGSVLPGASLLLAPLVAALMHRCGGWRIAAATLLALMATLWLSGLATAQAILALAVVGALVVAMFEWITRAALVDAARLAAMHDGERLRADDARAAAWRSLEHAHAAALGQALVQARSAEAASQRAIRGREELLSLVSHDLRSALNAMVGWLYLARSPTADAGARQRALEGISSAVETQRRLVDQLLDATRLLSGRAPAESRPVHPDPLFQRVSVRLAQRAAERSIELCVATTDPRLSFLADASRVEESLYAMGEHALAVTPAHGVVRMAARTVADQAEPAILLEVEGDAGTHSLAPLDRQASVRAGGHAASPTLSMAIARVVTELQGGVLEVNPSTAGAGARLSLRFAALGGPAPEAAEARAEAAPSIPGFFEDADFATDREGMDVLSGCYILLTDDREDMLEVGATVLRRHGAHVTTARSGAESIDRYREWALGGGERLLISDLSMPEMDGLEMIGRIRRLEREAGLPRVPAVAFSAQADQYPRRTVMQAGFDLFLAKPISPAQLIGAISAWIGK